MTAMRRIQYFALLLGLTIYYLADGQWLPWILLVTAAAAPWLSLILSIGAIRSFRVSAAGASSATQGEEAKLWLLGSCGSPMPPFRGFVTLQQGFTGETMRYRAETGLPTHHCGSYLAMPEKVRVFDYLGLFSFRAKAEAPIKISVYPRPVPIPNLPEPASQEALRWKPKPVGFSECHELRPYRPGDSLSTIHWKLTAKRGSLICREPMEPVLGQPLLTMTLSGSPDALDRKLGRLLWLGNHLLAKGQTFVVRALTGQGIAAYTIRSQLDLLEMLDALLSSSHAAEESIPDSPLASWQYHIGGQPDDA